MQYRFSQDAPITEEDALALAADMGFEVLAFDLIVDADEPLHWHEFDSVTWVIDGTGAFGDADGNVTQVSPGCRLEAPAGWLHRNLAGPPVRVVLSTSIPGAQWTAPIDKDPAERPAHLAV
jgi:hypothetical protein